LTISSRGRQDSLRSAAGNSMPQGEPPKIDGKVFQVVLSFPMRWKAYSPKSEQFRHGTKGRWQQMNEYGGWDNAPGAGRHFPFKEWEEMA